MNQQKPKASKNKVYINPDYKGHSQKVIDAVNKQSLKTQQEEEDKMYNDYSLECLMEGRKPWE
jgi:hypothetical protein